MVARIVATCMGERARSVRKVRASWPRAPGHRSTDNALFDAASWRRNRRTKFASCHIPSGASTFEKARENAGFCCLAKCGHYVAFGEVPPLPGESGLRTILIIAHTADT
jgi:hypothetical protein